MSLLQNRTLGTLAALTAVVGLGYGLVFRTGWFHDDWFFLAEAAGLATRDTAAVRFITFDWYWRIFYSAFGLTVWPWALSRLVMHGAAAWLTARIGRHAGLTPNASLLAGLVFAAAPVAFESLYWGTGAVEIIGALFALAAVERWLAGGRSRYWALLLTALAICSKESGLLLPVFFALTLHREGNKSALLWNSLLLLLAAGAGMAWLVTLDFRPDQAYDFSLTLVPRNLLVLGYWLAAPPSLMLANAHQSGWAWVTGGVLWLGFATGAVIAWRRNNPFYLACLITTVLSLAPATILADHVLPRYAYAAAAPVSLAVVAALFSRLKALPTAVVVFAAILLTAFTYGGTRYHLDARNNFGLPRHRLVVKAEIADKVVRGWALLDLTEFDQVVMVFEREVPQTERDLLVAALGDDRAIRLLKGPGVSVRWTDDLSLSPKSAYLIRVGPGFRLARVGRF